MSLTSDISLDESRFSAANITEETIATNVYIEQATVKAPKWTAVGSAVYREMLERSETIFPAPVYLDKAYDTEIPSRDAARLIPLRVYKPDNGLPSRAILMHFHGGGFVIATHRGGDSELRRYANKCQVTAVSVGYRLAPEDPYPAALHDAQDAATYLADHGPVLFDAPLLATAGESAGSCLAVQAVFHLIRERPNHRLAGVTVPYGWFDLSVGLPTQVLTSRPVLINTESMIEFRDAYLGEGASEKGRTPEVSPLYEDIPGLAAGAVGGKLPPALLICGTADPLLDDTLLMGVKWQASGSEAIIKIYPGAAHAFGLFPGYSLGEEVRDLQAQFLREKLNEVLGSL